MMSFDQKLPLSTNSSRGCHEYLVYQKNLFVAFGSSNRITVYNTGLQREKEKKPYEKQSPSFII